MRENNAGYAKVNLTDGAATLLIAADADPAPSVAQLSPSGGWLSYLSVWRSDPKEEPPALRTVHDLVVVPTGPGTLRVLARDLPAADPTVSGYVWHPTHDQVFWIEDGHLWSVDLSVPGSARRQISPDGKHLAQSPLAVLTDGDTVVVAIGPTGHPDQPGTGLGGWRLAMAAVNAASWVEVDLRPLYQLQRLIPGNDSCVWTPAPGVAVALATHLPTGELALLEIDFNRAQVTVNWQGRARLEPVQGLPSGEFLAAYEDLNQPANVYRIGLRGQLLERLTDVNLKRDDEPLWAMRTVHTPVPSPTRSGPQSASTVIVSRPARPGDHEAPPGVLLLYPGGGVGHFGAQFAGGAPSGIPILPLLRRGFVVLLAEAPLSPEGHPGQPLQQLADVIVPQLHHTADLGLVDPARIAIAGHSYGAYAAAAVICATDAFQAAVAISGIYDLPGMYGWNDFTQLTSKFWYFETGQARMGTHPWADRQRYLNNSPYYQADHIHTPLLLLHGAADPYCPVAESGKMFNALKRLDRTADLAVYDHEGHDPTDWSEANITDATTRVLDFLTHHLPAGPPTHHLTELR